MGIEYELVQLLKDKNFVIVSAESLTGGRVANKITNVSGSSNIFKEGYVVYSNEAKKSILQVKDATLKKYGAISKECCEEMCMGALHKAVADIAISTTGNAGPDGMEGKEVGLVYIGVLFRNNLVIEEKHYKGDRENIKELSSNDVLDLARKVITNNI